MNIAIKRLKITMIIVEKAITNEMVEEKIKELKPIHPELAQVAETIHKMDLKETVNAILVIDALEVLLKVHAMREARGKKLGTDEMAQEVVKELRPKHPVLVDYFLKRRSNGYERNYRFRPNCS